MKSLKIKLNLSYSDQIKLNTLSNEHREVYNICLEKAKLTNSFKEIESVGFEYRRGNNLTIQSHSTQWTMIMLENSMKSFFKLRKKDKSAKFPYRFKSHRYFSTFKFTIEKGFKVRGSIINIQDLLQIKIPEKCLNIIRNSKIKEIIFKKENGNYFYILIYENIKSLKINNQNFLSIDLGVSNIATCFSNVINNFQIKSKKFNEKSVDYVQSLRDLKKKGSIQWNRLFKTSRRLKAKICNQRKDYQHKVSRKIIDICKNNQIGNLIIGDIQTKKLPQSKIRNKTLNRNTQNSGILSRFKTFLVYKAENAGIDAHLINEAYTSQINCLTGKREFDSSLYIREVRIKENLTIDRDLNSAINIARRWAVWFSQDLFHFELDRVFV